MKVFLFRYIYYVAGQDAQGNDKGYALAVILVDYSQKKESKGAFAIYAASENEFMFVLCF